MPTSPDLRTPNPTDDHEPSLAGELRIALVRTTRRLRAQRGEADLSEGQLAVLTTLDRHGPLTPGQLAEHERIRPPSMTRTVNGLADLGLVRKADDPADARCVVVHLTPEGSREIEVTRRRRDAWLSVALDELTDEERATLHAAAQVLLKVAAR